MLHVSFSWLLTQLLCSVSPLSPPRHRIRPPPLPPVKALAKGGDSSGLA